MASLRPGAGYTRPSEEPRIRRRTDSGSQGSIPRPMNRALRTDVDPVAKPVAHSFGHSRLPSRVPQPLASARQSPLQTTSRPSPDHEATSWGSASTTTSGRSMSHTQSGSGSSTSSKSQDSNARAGRNVLRRKKTTISNETASRHRESPGPGPVPSSRGTYDSALGIQFDRGMTESPAALYGGEQSDYQQSMMQAPVLYPELDRYRDHRRPIMSPDQSFELPYKLSTQDLPPPTPASLLFSGSSTMSASPSTKFSGSPGPGPYSRDTTPTSMSSQSPGLVAPSRLNPPKARQMSNPSLTRPPVTRRRTGSVPNEVDAISADPHGLAAVRESLNSSSSSSTVKDGDRNGKKERKVARHLPPPPPSPPPRKSSQMFRPAKVEERDIVQKQPSRLQTTSTLTSVAQPSASTASRQQRISSPTKPATPRRPSRDGTPDIHSQLLHPAPVIHSNLSSSSLPTERRGSESNEPRPSFERKKNSSTSQLPTGRDSTSTSRIAAPTSKSRKLAVPEPSHPSRTPSPNVGSSFRFPFFGRKKTSDESTQTGNVDKKDKKDKKSKPRKGPAAGTGHEGYGRLGAVRRRSGSGNLTRGPQDTSMSTESLAGGDAFLADRINPVVIAGGEVIENRNTSSELSRTESNQSLPGYRPSLESGAVSDVSSASHNPSRTNLPSYAQPRRPGTASSRRPSEGSDSEGPAMKSTIAFRRSMQRLRTSPDNPLRLPQPINTSGAASSPMTSFDTSVMSDDSFVEMQREVSRGRDANHPVPKKLTKRSRSPRKWNPFSRSQTSVASVASKKKGDQLQATVQTVETRSVPFYAMMESPEQDDTDSGDIQSVLRNADVYTNSPKFSTPDMPSSEFKAPEIPRPGTSTPPLQSRKVFHEPFPGESSSPHVELRSKPVEPVVSSTGPQVPLPAVPIVASPAISQVTAPSVGQPNRRPSRLRQVGRIPKVVSNRPEQHASPKSFSRPFRTSMHLQPQITDVYDPESIAKGPSPEGLLPVPDLIQDGSTVESGTNMSSTSSQSKPFPEPDLDTKEFLRFSPRKNSEGTVGTSSSSSVMYLFATATAVIPRPDDPPAEDEVWDEYDDLLGDDHGKPRLSTTSSKGAPFHLEPLRVDRAPEKAMESPTFILDSRQASMHSKATASSYYSADMTERIRTAFQPHPSPLAPSIPEFSGPQDTGPQEEPNSFPIELRPSSPSPESDRKSEASFSSAEDNSPLAQVNLRVGSMTVSKWLTFGHVLFSDVRHELVPVDGSLKRQSILVIDGLGNDDWSFYAAETYPAATFFNLSPRAPIPKDAQNSPSGFPLSPPNHHQLQYISHMEKFPFAPQSFTSVVYRFPVAAPESHYWNILTEARRVLKPDGYLELSILDVDLNNMGNRGRRAIRQLKEGIHQTTPDTNLSSTADLLVRLIGKAGFTSIKAARVGVPVASPVARSQKDLKSTEDGGKDKSLRRDQPSLSEMMSDNSSTGDESITKMVARVGRWWYTRCYESAADSLTATSIWDDRALLRECEELGTSLKLMVCCGRAPERVSSM